MKTVRAATAMKTPVATTERGDRRARPQTPWPLVQPEPQRVPKPTIRPPSTSSQTSEVICTSGLRISAEARAAPPSRPAMKRRPRVRGAPFDRPVAAAVRPETPATRPFSNR